jgi:calcineurin-like phosphoesterase family protein
MPSIKWLHLSDFHVGKDNYGQRKLFSQIHQNVAARIAVGFIPDFVFLSGDIANKGKAEEYEEFTDSFLLPLISVLGDDWTGSIFSIPGNHDVQRDTSKFFNPQEVLKAPDHLFDPTEQGKEQRGQFVTRFENYIKSDLTNSRSRWIASNEAAFFHMNIIRGETVGIVGVNTAWLSKNDADRHLLTPGPNILEDALTKIRGASVRIVLGHHPLHWLTDHDAQQIRVILGKFNAIYLHGHLHMNDVRYDDSGSSLFLTIQTGAAFQGRAEDNPQLISGLVWAELNVEDKSVLLQPQHWSVQHREWKISTDAFSNQRKLAGLDWWQFPVPGTVPLAPQPSPSSAAKGPSKQNTQQSEGSISVRNGWEFVDKVFLQSRSLQEPPEQLLQFFDGRPPSWRLALSSSVPRRAIVELVCGRMNSIEDASKPTILNLIGAGGEGKSTAFLQIVARLVNEGNWIALWRHAEAQSIDVETIERFSKQFPRVIVAIDEAHSAASWLPPLLVRMKRLAKANVHFLLCSRSIDWRAEARELGLITRDSDYQEIRLRGLTRDDARQVVHAWGALGREGLRNLFGQEEERAAETLCGASLSGDTEEQEGAFLGAMLRLRYGDSLKDKIRSILYRLKDIPAPGGSLLDAYAMIAGMHNEGLRFLSLPVLAEALGCSHGEVQRKIINPLADEAIAAGGGRFVLCRHKAIAEATVEVLNETNLYGEIDESFAVLSHAAIVARQKGQYVPDLQKWDYTLPEHFSESGRHSIAIAAAEQMHAADPTDIRLRVNLSKVYRQADENLKAAKLFRDFEGELATRVAWHEWAVAERGNSNHLPSLILAAISVCDVPSSLPTTKSSAAKALSTMSLNLKSLYDRYKDPIYLQAILVVTQFVEMLGIIGIDENKATSELNKFALENGATLPERNELLPAFSAIIQGVATLVNFELFAKGRVPRAAIAKYDGLASHLR